MTRVLVYEHITATVAQPDPGDSLYREGRAMRDAVVADFERIPKLSVIVPDRATLESSIRSSDFSLIIAPEFDGILESLVRMTEGTSCRLLGPDAEGIRFTADKWRIFQHWRDRAVPTPETSLLSEASFSQRPCLVKPRGSCGSIGIRELDSRERFEEFHSRNPGDEWIVQSIADGLPASIAFLIGRDDVIPLCPTRQIIDPAQGYAYRGGELPLNCELSSRAISLGRRATDGIPGLFGYVGVDLILGNRPDGSADFAIEINPRLTTSYVGLREQTPQNLAEQMLRLACGEPPHPIEWRSDVLNFTSDGRIRRF